MDERRDPDADDGTRRAAAAAVLAAGVGQLSPVQQAYSTYTRHSIGCDDCRDIDRGCDVAEELWRAYQTVSRAACDQIGRGSR